MAFVSSVTLAPHSATLTRSSVCGARVSARSAPVSSTAVRMDMSPAVPFLEKPDNLSADMPGYAGFDPLGFSNYLNVKFLQEAEIKHSRVCMLAFLGLLVSELYTFPFYAGAPKLARGIHDWGVGQGSMVQLLLWVGIFEMIVSLPALVQMVALDSPRKPGEFSFDPLGLAKSDDAMKKYGTAELVNGRLAMIGVGGMIHHQFMTNMGTVQQLTSGKLLP